MKKNTVYDVNSRRDELLRLTGSNAGISIGLDREIKDRLAELDRELIQITYSPGKQISYIIESDGDQFIAHYDDFTNLAESHEYAFGDTPQIALQNFIDSRGRHYGRL
jgi:hypothetical protein